MGRPKKDISPEQVENLAAIQCTDLEICAVLGISHDTLMRRKREPAFMEALENGRAKGRASLRRAQFKAATSGNTALLVWLGKQFLDQRDKPEESSIDDALDKARQIRDALKVMAEVEMNGKPAA